MSKSPSDHHILEMSKRRKEISKSRENWKNKTSIMADGDKIDDNINRITIENSKSESELVRL